ncbi:MAG TPA: DUF420 domain-containing protein [Bacteroidota bacterium]|nr:DUF420 domain-containing protein [Bacteroidota bacterium]
MSFLPTLNAFLNATCGVLLFIGHRYMKHGDMKKHKSVMIGAFSVSVVFLISYLTYHYSHGTTHFPRTGFIRYLYFTILTSHTILAATVVPLAIITLNRGLKNRVALHRKIAKWTYPIWMYVSVTGVIVYLMLYHM